MRLWHKDLIHVLPRQQLLAQWRECCCIARNIAENGTPNHILVNKILDYPAEQFIAYCSLVTNEMAARGYKVNDASCDRCMKNIAVGIRNKYFKNCDSCISELYKDWHNTRYYQQCYYNLQEKYDCGGITEEEWMKIKWEG